MVVYEAHGGKDSVAGLLLTIPLSATECLCVCVYCELFVNFRSDSTVENTSSSFASLRNRFGLAGRHQMLILALERLRYRQGKKESPSKNPQKHDHK